MDKSTLQELRKHLQEKPLQELREILLTCDGAGKEAKRQALDEILKRTSDIRWDFP